MKGFNRSIDYDQVAAMMKLGMPAGLIARRLKRSERSIFRIKKELNLKRGPNIGRYLGGHGEFALWKMWYNRTGSHELVAWMFGVSRITVFFKLGLHKIKREAL